jgi:CRISPR-associated protein Cmx8
MTAASTVKTKAKRPGKAASNGAVTLEYSLAELPSAQHRAGLAGLVLMLRWLERQPGSKPGVCKLARLDNRGAAVTVDLDGLRRIFDETYGATKELQPRKQLWKDSDGEPVDPVRTEVHEITDAKGKTKIEKLYYYDVVVPRAGLIGAAEPSSGDGSTPWTKLWRDFLWEVLRGVPMSRTPFVARANNQPTKDALEAWTSVTGSAESSVDLPSTYYLGAQAKTAENVAVRDRTRYQFLLHFWPYAAQIYVPRVTKVKDGETEFVGYAIAVPDIAALEDFCDELREALRSREAKLAGYRPAAAVIDLPAEGALDLARRLDEQVATRLGHQGTSDLVLGYEVFHMDKVGKNVRLRGVSRVEPERRMIDAYVQLRGLDLWSPFFRRQRLANLLAERPWYAGFDRLIETLAQDDRTIGSVPFRHDARVSFNAARKASEGTMKQGEGQEKEPKGLEELIHQVMLSYVIQKLDSKHGLRRNEITDDGGKKAFDDKKHKIAKDAFLAVRSRTGAAFVDYFAGTLCSVTQRLSKPDYLLLTQSLKTEHERVRTLTLLALSAVS